MVRKSSTQTGMPSLILIILLLIVSAFAACILTPLAAFAADRLLSLKNDLRMVFVQTVLGMFLLLCVIFRSSLKSNVRTSLNLPFYTVILHFLIGIAVAFLFVAIAAGIVWLFGIKGVEINFSRLLWRPLILCLIGGFVGEIIHRGFIFQSLSSEISAFPAVILSSAFFALIRFTYAAGETISSGGIDFLSGFKTFPHLFDGFSRFQQILPSMAGCFLIGILFAVAYLRLNSLYAPIGMHAFLVFTDSSGAVMLSDRLFAGRDIIFGSHGTILEALPGGIMAWILLLLAIIGFLSIGGLSRKQNNRG